MSGWRWPNLAFSTTSINPDIDIHPTRSYELIQHPTKPTHTTLHRPDGTTICNIENRKIDKLHEMYKNMNTNPPFAESLAKLMHRNDTKHLTKKFLIELQLSKAKKYC